MPQAIARIAVLDGYHGWYLRAVLPQIIGEGQVGAMQRHRWMEYEIENL